MKLTAVYQKFPKGYVAFVEELPGANTQGKTLEEAKRNLIEVVNFSWKAVTTSEPVIHDRLVHSQKVFHGNILVDFGR